MSNTIPIPTPTPTTHQPLYSDDYLNQSFEAWRKGILNDAQLNCVIQSLTETIRTLSAMNFEQRIVGLFRMELCSAQTMKDTRERAC